MKNVFCKVVFIGLIAVSARAFGGTPVALTLVSAYPSEAEVYGLHLSILGGPCAESMVESVNGLSIGCFEATVSDEMQGVQISGLFAWDECVRGLQAGGIFAMAEKAAGIELAGVSSCCRKFKGVQLAGLLAQADSCGGLQLAFYNGSASMCGVQIGVLNFAVPAKDGWVVQLGLVNGIGKDEKCTWTEGIRYLPIMNVGW